MYLHPHNAAWFTWSQAVVPRLWERHRKTLSPRQLSVMNLAQTQVLYNYLNTQIESTTLQSRMAEMLVLKLAVWVSLLTLIKWQSSKEA